MTEVVGYALGIGMGAAIALVFTLLHFKRTVRVAEPNRYIRAFELVMALSIVGYYVYLLVRWIRRRLR